MDTRAIAHAMGQWLRAMPERIREAARPRGMTLEERRRGFLLSTQMSVTSLPDCFEPPTRPR